MSNNKTPFRFTKLMHICSKFFINSPKIQGLNNLVQIPPDQPLIVASTHLSDIDVHTIAANIAPYRNVCIASRTSNQRDFIMGSYLRLAGIENVFGITNEYDSKKHYSRYRFNHEDFRIMSNAIQKGKTIVIAAHNPTYDWRLPEKPGKGAVYLAQLSNALILPVALDIQSDKPTGMSNDTINTIKRFILRKKPDANMIIGKPIMLSVINKADLEYVKKLYQNTTKQQISKQDMKKAKAVLKKIKEQAQIIMEALTKILPPEKRAIANPLN